MIPSAFESMYLMHLVLVKMSEDSTLINRQIF